MAFSRQRAIIAQSSATAAVGILGPWDPAEQSLEDYLLVFESTRAQLTEGAIAIAGGDEGIDDEPRRSYGGGGRKSSTRSTKSADYEDDHGAGVRFKNGKHAGSTIEEVYGKEPEFLQWLAENGTSDFYRGKAKEFLASVS